MIRKITLWLLFLFASWQTFGQVSAYTFSQSSGTYTPISGGTVLGSTTTDDQRFVDPAVPAGGTVNTGVGLPIGFNFVYNGFTYDRFAVNANGWISLGDSSLGANAVNVNTTSAYTSLSSTSTAVTNDLVARIAGLNRDLQSQTGGELRFETIGTAPNRTLVIQWTGYRRYNVTGDNLNFQIRLNETSNVVEVVFGTVTVSASATYMVGLRANPNTPATNFNSRTSTTDWSASTASAAAGNTMTASGTIFPASGLTYIWTPPSCVAPTGITASVITSSTATLSWNAAVPAPSNGYQYYYSTINTPPAGAGTPEATTSVAISSLSANTVYYVWVRSDCGGSFSAWAGPYSFTTLCNTFVAPWTYNVETATPTTNSSVADCWSSIPTITTAAFRWDIDGAGGTPSTASTGPSGANSGVNYFYTEASSGTTGAVAELYSPSVDISALSAPTLQFYYHMRGINMGELHVDVYNGSSWVNDVDVIVGQQQTAAADPWALRIVSLSSFSGTIRVRFRGIRGAGFEGDMSLDDISFVEAPACFDPINVATSNITSSSFDLSWVDASGGAQFDFYYVVQPAGTGLPVANPENYYDASSGFPFTVTCTDDSNCGTTGLTSNTAYEVYVRADCSGTWVGPINVTTACGVYSVPSLENFTTYVPACWQEADNGDLTAGPATFGASGWAVDGFGNVGTTGAFKYNIFTTGANDWVLSPLYNIPATGYELKFDAAATQYASTTAPTTAWEADDFVEVLVSTGTTNWTVLYTYNNSNVPSNTGTSNIIDLDAYAGQVVRFAFRAVEGASNGAADIDFSVDNFEIRLTPVSPPACATNVVATPDASCGNFNNVITWNASSGADGYYITIGTTSGGNDVVNNQNLGAVLTYSFVGNTSTTYYVTVVPYNGNGPATGCSEVSFMTVATGCYCIPTYTNGGGGDNITNVAIGAWSNASTGNVSPYYVNYTTQQPSPIAIPDLAAGTSVTVNITMGTDSNQYSRVWIDFNQNYTFEASESFSLGTNAGGSGTSSITVNIPPGATLGQTRMRIRGGDDSAILATQACGASSSTWGEAEDYLVNIIAATCTQPTVSSSTIVPNCGSSQFSVDVNVTGLGSGTPVLSDGTSSWPISGTGVVTAGPFASGSSVTLTVLHGSDNTCDLPLGSFTYTCPPANDDLCNAIPLTIGAPTTANDYSIVGATTQTNEPLPACFIDSNLNATVWFSFVAPSTSVEVTTDFAGGTLEDGDTQIAVYDATGVTCSDLSTLSANIGCDDDGGTTVNFASYLTLTTLTPGNTYYIQVDHYNGTTQGTFGIQVNDLLSTNNFNSNEFVAYPNPVKNVLNLEYANEISSVRVINMLGQEVLSRTINATSTQVDMSQLAAGTYLVNFTSGDIQKTIKVVKQ